MSRILSTRTVDAWVALDNIDDLALRLVNLLADKRRISMATRYLDSGASMELSAGLTVVNEPKLWDRQYAKGIGVQLSGGVLNAFGLSAYVGESDTEQQARANHDPVAVITDCTWVRMCGGLPGDSPAQDDKLVIRQYRVGKRPHETYIAFDFETGWAYAQMQARDARSAEGL